VFLRARPKTTVREMAAEEVRQSSAEDDADLVELDIVGESYRQDALAAIAGPKQEEDKRTLVGVTLRCEPANEHDPHAIRVEVMGTLLAYMSRLLAAVMSPAMQDSCGGVLEARGLIVGGWRDARSEGHYGIRVWITQDDSWRLGLRPDVIDPRLRPRWPDPPEIQENERRLSPTRAEVEAKRYGSTVSVTCEEHYQDAIAASMPAGWDPDRTWPLLVDLVVVSSNPHTKHGTPCIEVRAGADSVGYFTPKMSERHLPSVEACAADGKRATAQAHAFRGAKGAATIWRVKVHIRP
jgi:hypothetical protein